MTEPKPVRPVVGQRWRFDGEGKACVFEVAQVYDDPDPSEIRAQLRGVKDASASLAEPRTVRWGRLSESPKYVYLGDFSVPARYSIHEISPHGGGHCFKDPFGHVEGPPPGESWSWKQARDAAVADAQRRTG